MWGPCSDGRKLLIHVSQSKLELWCQTLWRNESSSCSSCQGRAFSLKLFSKSGVGCETPEGTGKPGDVQCVRIISLSLQFCHCPICAHDCLRAGFYSQTNFPFLPHNDNETVQPDFHGFEENDWEKCFLKWEPYYSSLLHNGREPGSHYGFPTGHQESAPWPYFLGKHKSLGDDQLCGSCLTFLPFKSYLLARLFLRFSVRAVVL